MKNLEGRIRASYSDEITMRSDDIANAMLLDGFFILDLLLDHSRDTQLSSDDFLLRYDLLFVENQIPFFLKFKNSEKDSSFLDIQFEKGVMQIPTLEVHDYRNSLFRNLIAFEQCDPGTDLHITIYAAFMDFLLKTPEDARLLHLSGILINRVATNQDTPHFFSQLCNQVHYAEEKSYLKDLCEHVNNYRRTKWHKWMADFVRKHIGDPWLITALVASTYLLLIASGQTFYTIYPYYHK